jgi:hypothetical protein
MSENDGRTPPEPLPGDVVDHSSNDQSRKRPADAERQRRLDRVRDEVKPRR